VASGAPVPCEGGAGGGLGQLSAVSVEGRVVVSTALQPAGADGGRKCWAFVAFAAEEALCHGKPARGGVSAGSRVRSLQEHRRRMCLGSLSRC